MASLKKKVSVNNDKAKAVKVIKASKPRRIGVGAIKLKGTNAQKVTPQKTTEKDSNVQKPMVRKASVASAKVKSSKASNVAKPKAATAKVKVGGKTESKKTTSTAKAKIIKTKAAKPKVNKATNTKAANIKPRVKSKAKVNSVLKTVQKNITHKAGKDMSDMYLDLQTSMQKTSNIMGEVSEKVVDCCNEHMKASEKMANNISNTFNRYLDSCGVVNSKLFKCKNIFDVVSYCNEMVNLNQSYLQNNMVNQINEYQNTMQRVFNTSSHLMENTIYHIYRRHGV